MPGGTQWRAENNHLTIELQLLRYSQPYFGIEKVQEKKQGNSCSIFLDHTNLQMFQNSGFNQRPPMRIRLCISILLYWLAELHHGFVVFLRP